LKAAINRRSLPPEGTSKSEPHRTSEINQHLYLEFELLRDKDRNTLHHSLTGTLAAHVDIAIAPARQ
jgi:hypothetical protein